MILCEKGQDKTVVFSRIETDGMTEAAGGFVGCTVGMYAVTAEGSDEVYFKKFTYSG